MNYASSHPLHKNSVTFPSPKKFVYNVKPVECKEKDGKFFMNRDIVDTLREETNKIWQNNVTKLITQNHWQACK